MIKKIKRLLPESLKTRLKLLTVSSKQGKWVSAVSNTRKNIFIFLCGFYQNLGDMALTFSQMDFLKKEFPEANLILVPSVETYTAVKTIKKHIGRDDLITILGGGNMDDIYVSLENARLHVIKSFSNNRIICFPQTYAFSDSKHGKKREAASRKIYEKHKRITIFVRERHSLQRIKKSLPNTDVRFCPDIVLSLQIPSKACCRDRVLICFRKDKEQRTEEGFAERILSKTHQYFSNVIVRDTVDVSKEDCQPDTYISTLNQFWAMIQECKVVITDRLHCMLFCVITRTPCIALDNSNHKISGVYDAWLREIPYIHLFEDEDAETIISTALEIAQRDYSNYALNFSDEFAPLRKALHE